MIGKNVKSAFVALAWIVGSAMLALLIWALAQGCVPTDPLKDAVRDGLRDGLHKGISEGLASASGIASDKLLVLLPDIIDRAVSAATEKVVAKLPEPRELPVGVEAGIAFVAAVGFRAFDHWRKRRREMVAMVDAVDDAIPMQAELQGKASRLPPVVDKSGEE